METKEIIHLIELVYKIADKYTPTGEVHAAGFRGLLWGLNTYEKCDRKEKYKLDVYVL